MAVNNRKFCNKVFAFVFVECHIFLSSAANKKSSVNFGVPLTLISFFVLFLVDIESSNFVIISDASVSGCLLMLVPFFVLVIF